MPPRADSDDNMHKDSGDEAAEQQRIEGVQEKLAQAAERKRLAAISTPQLSRATYLVLTAAPLAGAMDGEESDEGREGNTDRRLKGTWPLTGP